MKTIKKKKMMRKEGSVEMKKRAEGGLGVLLAIGDDVGETGSEIEDEDTEGDVVDPPGDGVEELLGIALFLHQELQQHTQHQLPVHRHRRYHVHKTQSC